MYISIENFGINGKNLAEILADHKKWLEEPIERETSLRANLRLANLRLADLSGANLRGANLRLANLSDANLSGANLSDANLRLANLRLANLSGANLSVANLSDANLSDANLSDAKNLLNPVVWLAENFEADELGYIVYKAIGDTTYAAPDHWEIEAGKTIEEVVNPLPTVDCACGVNFATLKWVRTEYADKKVDIWRCCIRWEWLPGVVVPFNTTGKARCNKLELIEKVGGKND
jgi:hypothetical protein